jgi:hypothetical protein
MMRIVSLIIAVSMTSMAAQAILFWGAETPELLILDADNSTPLLEGETATTGVFGQLIRILTGTTAGSLLDQRGTGTGLSANEVVADYGFAGQFNLLGENGYFGYGQITPPDTGTNYYYVRIFNTPHATVEAFNNAYIPEAATHYYQSIVYSYVRNSGDPPPVPGVTIEVGGNYTSLEIVPEPGVLAMMGLGLFGLATVRRRLQS